MDNKRDFIDKLISISAKSNITIKEINAELFYDYYKLVTYWNKKLNLTAIKEESEIIEKHFVDSLLITKHCDELFGDNVIDIGTGAGFPGIPLKIFYPEMNITFLDSSSKKKGFLLTVVNDLGLNGIQILNSRAEVAAHDKNMREHYSTVISRAVAPLNILSEYCLPFCKISGKAVFYKGKQLEDELEDARKAIEILGGEIGNVSRETLPVSQAQRYLLVINKISPTPQKYPRKPGKPQKRPL